MDNDGQTRMPRWIPITTGVLGLAAALLVVGIRVYEFQKARAEVERTEQAAQSPQPEGPPQTSTKPVPLAKDPIVGSWRAAFGSGKKQQMRNLGFFADGRTERGGKWSNDGNGQYSITGPDGATIKVHLSADGKSFKGKGLKGNPVHGVKQATP